MSLQPKSDTNTPENADCTLPTGSTAPTESLDTSVCVVGGGLAGLCAALASARSGVPTVLVQDRHVLGGNASSEIRMWALGAHGADNTETGLMEEIRLANLRYNPERRYSVWDSVLYGLAREQENLTLILSCAIAEVSMANDTHIASVRGWHLTRQCWITIHAENFIDCSGDSILRLSGAPCRWGREAKSSSAEAHAQDQADRKTMGNSILIQLREIDPEHHEPYMPPAWALQVEEDTFPNRKLQPTGHNFWWLEIGGLYDTLDDADLLRDDLVALAHGVWAFIKNHPDGRGHNWELEWVGALPGKRENIRYRTLYSVKIDNLWFAGRNIGCTHMAMSSTRVMATCAALGQAAGTAAAISAQHNCSNRAVYEQHLDRLQRRLLNQDQWLPGRKRPVAPLMERATLSASSGNVASLIDGVDRRTNGDQHRWDGQPGDWIQWSFHEPVLLDHVRIIGDSKLSMLKVMPCSFPLKGNRQSLPDCLPRDLRLQTSTDGEIWETIAEINNNYRRLIEWNLPAAIESQHFRLVVDRGWGNGDQRVSLFAAELGRAEATGTIPEDAWPRTVEQRGGGGA